MVIHEMTQGECRAMLAGTNVARLACARNNQPYIVPIRVDLDREFLYGYATLGQKIEWMRQNPLVCLEIDELTSHGHWANVVVFGHYEELSHTPKYEDARTVAEALFQTHPTWWEPASVPFGKQEQRTPIVFRIQISRTTGRRLAPNTVKAAHVREDAPEVRTPRWLTEVLRRMMGD